MDATERGRIAMKHLETLGHKNVVVKDVMGTTVILNSDHGQFFVVVSDGGVVTVQTKLQ